jgi:NAD(P)-dependent dehydrogenase (short-subunit alcohol dehydrogenase family)
MVRMRLTSEGFVGSSPTAPGATISTIAADASDPDGLGARMRELYAGDGAPGVIVYNAVMGAPDRLLSSSAAHLQAAYAVDVISAIVVAQAAAPAMRAAGAGTILVTGAGSPTTRSRPWRPFPSARRLCGRPRQYSAPTWNRTASVWPH